MANELVIKSQEDLVGYAQNFIKQNNIIVSKNYNVPNAMISLFNNVLSVKDKNNRMALETCTPMSIQNAIAECIHKELTPSKNQTYFIVYGNELKSQDSYFGNTKRARDVAGVDIHSKVVREGDKIDSDVRADGTMIIRHKPNLLCLDKPIIMAYAVASDSVTGEVIDSDIMSMTEIKKSWAKSKNGGSVSKEFPHEMARRTVTNRLAKHIINTSDDSRKVFITDIDGKRIGVSSYDELPAEEGIVATDYTINTLEQDAFEKEPFNPEGDEFVVTGDVLTLDPISVSVDVPDDAIEIDYNLVKGGANKDKFKVVPNTFNKSTYTCKAVVLNNEGFKLINGEE